MGNFGVEEETGIIRIGNMFSEPYACISEEKKTTLPVQTQTFIAGISGVSVTGGSMVMVNSSGQLGIQTSSRRFKQEIEPLGSADEKILKLRPVSFRYKKANDNETQSLQYGLIAEEVAEIMPELVQLDKDGKPFAVNYHLLAPLLLAMMQHEHKENQQQQELLMTLKEQNEALRNELMALRHSR